MSNFNSNKRDPVVFSRSQQIPIKYDDRPCTDIICIIIGLVFSIIMIVLGFTLFNYQNYVKSNFPTDSDGKLCGVDNAYEYLYFANAPQIDRRVCVKSCPNANDTRINCVSTYDVGCRYSNTPGSEVLKYDVYTVDQGRGGRFCFPTDNSVQQQLLANAKLENRFNFINSLDILVISMIFSLGLSILYLILVQCFPKFMNRVVPILALVLILALGICMYTYSNLPGKIPIAIVLTVGFILIAVGIFRHRNAVDINGIFLEQSTIMLRKEKCGAFLYIPLFIAFLTGFILIIVMEFRSYWTGDTLDFNKNESIFWEFKGAAPIVLSSFLLIQTIWGFSFLKEAFNFLVSGNAVSWYFGTGDSCVHPFRVFLYKHFGSVVAGSFMTGFFSLGDMIFDLLKPSPTMGPNHCCTKMHKTLCNPCTKVFDLVRSDAMGYIYLAGNPYCNSSRYCEYLCDNSASVEAAQTTSRAYRLGAHMLIASICAIIALYFRNQILPTYVLVVMFVSMFISTFFISMHADASEAILISFMTDEECQRREKQLPTDYNYETYQQMEIRKKQIADQISVYLSAHPLRRPNQV